MKKHFIFYIFLFTSTYVFSQEYASVMIGNQVWMTTDLNSEYFRNGELIPQAQSFKEWNLASQNRKPAWCEYVNSNGEINCKLYNYYAISSKKGIAPKGWHVPTRQEWLNLKDFIKNEGGSESNLASSGGWHESNSINSYGFTALPSVSRLDGNANPILLEFEPDGFMRGDPNEKTFWWSSTEYDEQNVCQVFYNLEGLLVVSSKYPAKKGYGYCVRLIKDDDNLSSIPSASVSTNESGKRDRATNAATPNAENNKNNKYIFKSNDNESKFKVVRVKERNPVNNYPVAIDIYDKSLSLKVGDNIVISRTDEVKIPGERKTIKSETTIGNARIVEEFNKPLFTARLVATTGSNMKDYRDGDENYGAVRGEENKTIIATPKIMVIPKKIDPTKYVNGEYQLTKEEKMLIAAFKNKFENNKFTTYGFESSLKSILENRQFNDNVKDDIKSKILESSGMDFFVEYENLDQNNSKCDKAFDFKIRNYSTGEDVASDVKNLNSCGGPEDYKSFASAILNAGAISKINTQFSSLLNNGRKVSVIFTIANSSQATFNKDYNGTKLKDHIENCLQGLAFNGNLDIEGVINLRMETTVNIPITNENTGKSYTTNTFSEDIIGYLKKNANVECESSVSKQIVNIKIK